MNLRRLWPFRRPAEPARVREFRIQGRPEVHRVEAGTPLADARERGAVVLFETDDPGRYALGEARDADGKLVAVIIGWTSHSLGHVVGADGTPREKRRGAAWGWPVDAREAEVIDGDGVSADPVGITDAPLADEPAAGPKRERRRGVPAAKRGG